MVPRCCVPASGLVWSGLAGRDAIGQRKKAAEKAAGSKAKRRRRDSDDEYDGEQYQHRGGGSRRGQGMDVLVWRALAVASGRMWNHVAGCSCLYSLACAKLLLLLLPPPPASPPAGLTAWRRSGRGWIASFLLGLPHLLPTTAYRHQSLDKAACRLPAVQREVQPAVQQVVH